jgi:hypothetical protein
MRQTGKTTRLVDAAVQYLFEHGSIRILTNSEIYNPNFIRGFKAPQVDMFLKFIDPDARPDNKAQYHFIDMLNKRLATEHSGSVERINNTEFKVIKQ